MSDIHGSPLDFELQRFLQKPIPREIKVKAIIHTGEKDLVPVKVVRFDISSNYEYFYKDEMSVTVSMMKGDLIFDVGPYQDDLRITIIEERYENGLYIPVDTMYRAYLLQEVPKRMQSSNSPTMNSQEAANLSELTVVGFSLEPVVMEYIDNSFTGTIVKSVAPFRVLNTLFANAIDSIVVSDEERIKSIDMYAPSNLIPMSQMVIPDQTPIVELPDLLQNKLGGIYSTGLGFFIQNKVVYFWPLYDTERESVNSKRLQIIIAPTKHYKTVENTLLVENDVVTVLGVGPLHITDDTLGEINDEGDSVRFLDARKALSGMGKAVDNRFIANRAEANTEISAIKTGSGIVRARQSKARVTSNLFVQTSKMSRRNGVKVSLAWRNSDRNLLIPGMPTTILYNVDGLVKEATGTLLGCTSAFEMTGKGLVEGGIVTTSVLTVFVNRDDPIFMDYVESGGKPIVYETN